MNEREKAIRKLSTRLVSDLLAIPDKYKFDGPSLGIIVHSNSEVKFGIAPMYSNFTAVDREAMIVLARMLAVSSLQQFGAIAKVIDVSTEVLRRLVNDESTKHNETFTTFNLNPTGDGHAPKRS